MDRKELNNENIELGKTILQGLDKDKFPVTAAFWLLDTDIGTWRYVLASPIFDKLGPIAAYKKLIAEIGEILGKSNFSKAVTLTSPNNAFIRLLKVAINTGPESISDIRFTGNSINNHYIDDAYLYRVS
jgi:hypothetical protein